MSQMSRPNVVLITSHDLGQYIEPYGIETVATPNLSRLAAAGARFAKSFCTSPGCSPSRAAIFTGRYPQATGVLGLTHGDFNWRMNDDERHIGQILRDAGWHTALSGGMHEHTAQDIARLGYNEYVNPEDPTKPTGFKYAPITAARTADWLTARVGQEQPFLLTIGFFEPHRVYSYGGVQPDDSRGVTVPGYIPQETDEQRAAAHSEFADLQGAVQALDAALGTVFDAIDANGFRDDTVVIFTADHGLAMPRAKGTLYDAGIEVPLIVRAPAWDVPAGTVVDGLVSNVDIVPTLLDGLGLPPSERVQGVSQYGHLTGGPAPRDRIFAEKHYHSHADPIRCVRTERWKYIVNFDRSYLEVPSDIQQGLIYRTSVKHYLQNRGHTELYDLHADPHEATNLAGSPAHAAVEAELRASLLAQLRAVDDPILHGPIRSNYYHDSLAALHA